MYLILFIIGADGDGGGDEHEDGEHGEVEPEVGKTTTFEADAAHNVDEIARWQNVGERLRPRHHRGDRSEESAQEHEYHHEEKHSEYSLLKRRGKVGDEESEPSDEEHEEYRRKIDYVDIAIRCNVVHRLAK